MDGTAGRSRWRGMNARAVLPLGRIADSCSRSGVPPDLIARAGIGCSIEKPAAAAHVGVATVARFETSKGETIPATLDPMGV